MQLLHDYFQFLVLETGTTLQKITPYHPTPNPQKNPPQTHLIKASKLRKATLTASRPSPSISKKDRKASKVNSEGTATWGKVQSSETHVFLKLWIWIFGKPNMVKPMVLKFSSFLTIPYHSSGEIHPNLIIFPTISSGLENLYRNQKCWVVFYRIPAYQTHSFIGKIT